MTNVKKILSLLLALSMFSSATFADTGTVRSIVRDYQIQVRVQNVDAQEALKGLTDRLLKSNVTQKELIEYVKSTSTPEEFESFLAMLEKGAEELSNVDYIDGDQFEHILGKVFANTTADMGANYNGGGQTGCYSTYFGYIAVAVSVILAINLIERRTENDTWLGDLLDRLNINFGNNMSDRQLVLSTAISGALGLYLIGRCSMK